MAKREKTPNAVTPPAASSGIPPGILEVMKSYPRFDIQLHDRRLHIFARNYHEFGFDLALTGNSRSDEDNLRRLVDYYNAPNTENATLDYYIQELSHLKQLGFTRTESDGSAQLSSTLHNPGGQSIGTIVSGKPEQLLDLIREDAIAPAEEAIIAQLEIMGKLEDEYGIKQKTMKTAQVLRLEHPRLRQGDQSGRVEIPMHLYGGNDYWLNDAGWGAAATFHYTGNRTRTPSCSACGTGTPSTARCTVCAAGRVCRCGTPER